MKTIIYNYQNDIKTVAKNNSIRFKKWLTNLFACLEKTTAIDLKPESQGINYKVIESAWNLPY